MQVHWTTRCGIAHWTFAMKTSTVPQDGSQQSFHSENSRVYLVMHKSKPTILMSTWLSDTAASKGVVLSFMLGMAGLLHG